MYIIRITYEFAIYTKQKLFQRDLKPPPEYDDLLGIINPLNQYILAIETAIII